MSRFIQPLFQVDFSSVNRVTDDTQESFKGALDEVREADILLHVVDISHLQYEKLMDVVNKTLQKMKAFEKTILTIFNKMGVNEQHTFDEWLEDSVKQEILQDLKHKWQQTTRGNWVFISDLERKNIDELSQTILTKVRDIYRIRYRYKIE